MCSGASAELARSHRGIDLFRSGPVSTAVEEGALCPSLKPPGAESQRAPVVGGGSEQVSARCKLIREKRVNLRLHVSGIFGRVGATRQHILKFGFPQRVPGVTSRLGSQNCGDSESDRSLTSPR